MEALAGFFVLGTTSRIRSTTWSTTYRGKRTTLVHSITTGVVNPARPEQADDAPAVELDEGAEVLVFPVSDDMDAQERAELGTMLDESFEDLRAGRTVDGPTYLRELRSRL